MNNYLLFHNVFEKSKIGEIGLFEWELRTTQKSELKIRKKPVIKEFEQYGYNPIKGAFFHLNKIGFIINDEVEKLYKNHKIKDKGFLIIKNK